MPPHSIAICRSRSAARFITRHSYSRAEAVGRKIDELLGTAVPGSSNGKRCAHLVRAGRSGDWNREIRWRRQRVIEHALPDARIRGNFEPSGLICTIEMPLAPPEERL